MPGRDGAAPALCVANWLALPTGGWSTLTLLRDNADLWVRGPLAMQRR